MAIRVPSINNSRWVEIDADNALSPDSVFIESDGGFCMEFDKQTLYVALQAAFGILTIAAEAESFLMGLPQIAS